MSRAQTTATTAANPSGRRQRRPVRRAASLVVAAAIALPLAVGAGIAPASASNAAEGATEGASGGLVQAVESGGYGPPPSWYGGYGGNGYGADAYGFGQDTTSTTTALDTTDATAEQSAGLVLITSTLDYGTGEAAGTGMVIDADGLVVTNHHVAADATSIEVTIAETGETYPATYVGGDATRDIAVLRLAGASGLTAVDTDTSGIATGDGVTSVGDAGGDGGSLTAAVGTVTDDRTRITVSGDDGTPSRLRGLIEVDADIVPGDSGGALLDADGEVVGMNVAASSGGSDITGYAIPVARVLRIADAIIAGETIGDVVLGYDAFLGVELTGTSTSPTLAGVIDDTAAATAGLAAGDTVTSVAGTEVSTAEQLSSAIATHDVGETVALTWTDAAGADHQAEVTLGAAPIA